MDTLDPAPSDSGDGFNASPALVRALRRLLRPLVRLMLAKGITYPYLIGLLKSLYVDVAAHDFPLQGKRQTDSRLSLLTGVHRKDVRRLMETPPDPETAPANVSFGARLVARWCSDSVFLDDATGPLPLPRLAVGNGPSFESLVAAESKDIRSRAVLDEWLRLGLVELDEQDRVCLRSGAFVPERGFEEKVYYLGRNVHDHLAAAAHNVLGQQPPMLERSVYSDGLSDEAVAELSAMAEKMGMETLHALNRRARELRESESPSAKDQRMTFGIYFLRERQEDHEDRS